MNLCVTTFRSFEEIARRDFGKDFVDKKLDEMQKHPTCYPFIAHLRDRPDIDWPSGVFRLLYAYLAEDHKIESQVTLLNIQAHPPTLKKAKTV